MRLFGQGDRLFGRDIECATLDHLITEARSGRSAALVLRGEAGVGKTALLRYARSTAPTSLAISGVEDEAGFPFAGLHRLLVPLLPGRGPLPAGQRAALEVACGLADGPPPDLYLVSLAALSLLAAAPRLCVIDDVQWLDRESALALAFVARRLHAEGVVMLFGERVTGDDSGLLAGVPVLAVGGLAPDAALALLSDIVTTDLDLALAERVAEESGGNPLALTDLGLELTADQWRGATALPEPVPIGSRLEAHYAARARTYPAATRTWLLIAAAGAGADADHVLAAARLLAVAPRDAAPAEADRLVTGSPPVEFRHPLVRSAIYGDAPPAERRTVHAALAEAVIDDTEADRRAWHQAAAAAEPDEEVAAALERSAARAGARGGYTARATFLNRAAELSPRAGDRAARRVEAAAAAMTAGAYARALVLLDSVDADHLSGPVRGSALLTRALAAVNTGSPTGLRDAPAMCLEAAAAFGTDHDRARRAVVQAIDHHIGAEHLSGTGDEPVAAEAARLAETDPDGLDGRLLSAYATFIRDGYEAGAPALRRAVAAITDPGLPDETLIRRFVVAINYCNMLWDDDTKLLLLDRAEAAARRAGALHTLDLVHFVGTMTDAALGRLNHADRHDAAGQRLRRSFGITVEQEQVWRHPELVTWRAPDGIRETLPHALQVFEMLHLGGMHGTTRLAMAVLEIGSAGYPAARELLLGLVDLGRPRRYAWALPDLVEAALRAGDLHTAERARADLELAATAAGTARALGLLDRSRALLAEPGHAETHYRDAIERLAGTPAHGDLARAHLIYGEWLRRRRRRRDARAQLASALDMFQEVRAVAFTHRTMQELAALGLGESARVPDPGAGQTILTPQEAAVAILARTGETNAEIAAQLFLSANTVDYHLRKVFRKLGVSSRRQLRDVLPD
ncbi:regulatory protein, luxR family [Actinoplanes philippinensis]|uniref:Regulatory protein, luxR family n=1 Tax=Actinoplanes philippinensis TaxID=35752 RepID=A0A1I2N0E3_9ACTN|nr:LuxR family transcriptional regulator [Actinoplanes philippinensis]SFF94841.1 regulatory protein, luxR family [Actinoplanes philippinensis]